jgi:hypothetical protein
MSILVISAPGPFLGEQLVGADAVGVVVGDGRDDQLVGFGGVAETFQLVRDLARRAGELGVDAVGDQLAVSRAPTWRRACPGVGNWMAPSAVRILRTHRP